MRALRDQRAFDGGAAVLVQPFDKPIVGLAVYAVQRQTPLRAAERDQFPVADMRGEEDAGPIIVAQRFHMFRADDLNRTVGIINVDFREMRKFGDGAGEVVPHATNDGLGLGAG